MHQRSIPSGVAVPLIVLAIAAGLRLWGLASPEQPYGDEPYYAFDAAAYLGGGTVGPIGADPPAVRIADEGTWVHPPHPWVSGSSRCSGSARSGSVRSDGASRRRCSGFAGVGLLYLLALRLWRSVWWAGFAALLLALDGLHIVQSRMAMLDIFVTTFVTAAVLFLVLDRERMEPRRSVARWPRVERLFGSPYRLWAGVFLGCAMATKWSGAFALPFVGGLCAIWIFTGHRRGDRTVLATCSTLVSSFAIVPLAVYLVSYGAFFYQHGFAIHDFWSLQSAMLHYQEAHDVVQSENSLPWSWPLLLHPFRYWDVTRDGATSVVIALGNPVLWWGFLLLLPVSIVQIFRRPVWQDAVVFGGYAAMFLPWFVVGRTQFIWYMLPAVPFMCLAISTTLRRMPAILGRNAGILFAGATIVAALLFLPAWTGWHVADSWIRAIEWLPDWSL